MKNQNINKKLSKRIKIFKKNFLSVCIYKTVLTDGSIYFDTVVYKKIKNKSGYCLKRGTNLKPEDVLTLSSLIQDVLMFFKEEQIFGHL